MQIEISDAAYRAIAAVDGDVAGFVERAVIDAIKKNAHTTTPRFDAEQVLAEARNLQGMFGEATLDEVLSDRRCGLE